MSCNVCGLGDLQCVRLIVIHDRHSQVQAPFNGDGGLVSISHSAMFCLSCPHSNICRHLVQAGAVADRPSHAQEPSAREQRQYLSKVHAAIRQDGMNFKVRGHSARTIVLPSLITAQSSQASSFTIQRSVPSPPSSDWGQGDVLSTNQWDLAALQDLCLDSSSDECGEHGVMGQDDCTVSTAALPDPCFDTSPCSAAISLRFQGLWHYQMEVDLHPSTEKEHVPQTALIHHFLDGLHTPAQAMHMQLIRRPLQDDDKKGTVLQYVQRLVLHVGAAYLVDVPQYAVGPDGTPQYFDGGDEGLVNMGRWLFTYEFLQSFLNRLYAGGATFRGYLRQALLDYEIASAANPQTAQLHDTVRSLRHGFECGEGRHAGTAGSGNELYKAFIDAVMDFITLQDVDYEKTLGCVCVKTGTDHSPSVIVYDNACHALDYTLAREPQFLNSFQFFVDKFHHKGHSACSPFMSHHADPATSLLNSSVMEQGNRCRVRAIFPGDDAVLRDTVSSTETCAPVQYA